MGTALLADIGGTNARFALLRNGRIGEIERYAVAAHPDLASAARHFLAGLRPAVAVDRAAIAVAGPVSHGEARLTNANWQVSARALSHAFGWSPVAVLNDFAAIALALPRLRADDLVPIGNGEAEGGAPLAVLGPGTGLGVAGLIPTRPAPVPLVTEGGHVTMPAADDDDALVIGRLRQRYGHVSAERILSGHGLVTLYGVLAEFEGREAPEVDAAAVVDAACRGDDALARAALDRFCAMLGTVAGDLALTVGARGGVYIAGGMVPRFIGLLRASEFRERFEAKGRFREYLAAVPTWVVTRPDPTFLGLAAALGE